MSVRVARGADGIAVETSAYRLAVDPVLPSASLTDPAGGAPIRLLLLAALDTEEGLDGTLTHGPPEVTEVDGGCLVTAPQKSTRWQTKEVQLACTESAVVFTVRVDGRGRLATVRLLGGGFTGNPRWGGGQFHSQWAARSLFSPSPDDPRRILQPASEAATIGVVGSSLPGRGHWFFTPAAFLLAGTPQVAAEPDEVASGSWQTIELRAAVRDATFTELRYAPLLGGFSLELAYEGATEVADTFTTPPLAIRLGVDDPYRALGEHADTLRATGLAPTVPRDPAEWWTRPIFCGWGEQCREARLSGGGPFDLSRQDRYDAWLASLAERGITPGTVVIDDKWQATYGRNEPDPARWPDLRGWIAERHAHGQRVLLWFKAWDPEGLPAEACVTDALGTPVAADPTAEAYAEILRGGMHAMLSPDGLDADGLKVDFTAQTPSGAGLHRVGAEWGVALLHRLLALVHRFAKEAKPDALVVTHAASPLFADVTDMVRLNDLMRLADPDPVVPAVPQMRHRARVAAAIGPGTLIDTDDWCMPSRAEWRAYLEAKPELGVPALYYATGIDHSGEAFTEEDYAAIRDAWARWEARRVQLLDR